ncbi:hypothetical protein Pcinc_020182 [Petrolisthes cinctipes]|uniref:Uncharacterized protein n=1 Tax=Petrolisthes cinctipes TaxID=88211 RepID=A0AAE1FJU2_PETCI|nr:hypothetical protein Pcinc_020182 [Petrolisthes cinctipes]
MFEDKAKGRGQDWGEWGKGGQIRSGQVMLGDRAMGRGQDWGECGKGGQIRSGQVMLGDRAMGRGQDWGECGKGGQIRSVQVMLGDRAMGRGHDCGEWGKGGQISGASQCRSPSQRRAQLTYTTKAPSKLFQISPRLMSGFSILISQQPGPRLTLTYSV